MQKILAITCYLFVLVAGCALMSSAWNGMVYVYLGENRSPAAVKDLNDYYPIDGRSITRPLDQQMFENLNFVRRESEMGIQLGHFLVHDSSGRRRFACQISGRPGVFDRIELSFAGVGISDDGKIPHMTVDSPCASGDNPALLETIWLPMSDIYQSEPSQQSLQLPVIGGANIHFDDLASAWPDRWTLVHVRLYHSQSNSQSLELEPRPGRGLSRGSFGFDWKPQ